MTRHDFDAIVGLDLSLTSTGVAKHVPGRGVIVDRIRSKGTKADTWLQRRDRLTKLCNDIVLRATDHALVIVEAPSYSSSGSGTHDRSGLWWLVFDQLHRQHCTIVPVAPSQRMKYALGVGGGKNASKDAVLAAAVKRYPEIDITGNDVADAVLLMAMGMRLLGEPFEGSLPQTHLDAMAKLALPVAAS